MEQMNDCLSSLVGRTLLHMREKTAHTLKKIHLKISSHVLSCAWMYKDNGVCVRVCVCALLPSLETEVFSFVVQ